MAQSVDNHFTGIKGTGISKDAFSLSLCGGIWMLNAPTIKYMPPRYFGLVPNSKKKKVESI
jgi:hypothetical protein